MSDSSWRASLYSLADVMMMKIVFFETNAKEQQYFSERLKKHKLVFFAEPLHDTYLRQCADADALCVFINSKITKHHLDQLPKVKLITTRSTGFDHIDVDSCKQRGITVCSVPDYGVCTVAEYTFNLILALSRKLKPVLFDGNSSVKIASQEYMGNDLQGKILGVIGTGKIGLHVITLAKGFGMDVLAYDVIKNEEKRKELGFTYVSFAALLQKADIITLHVPLLPSTQHLINKQSVQKMKKGVILINTSRGGVVETDALLDGLKQGIFKGVGLDVYEEEALLLQQPQDKVAASKIATLQADNRVILSPHIAYCTEEALQRILDTTLSHILSV